MRTDIEGVLRGLAARQDNVFSLQQARDAGADKKVRYRRVLSGRWVRVGTAGFRQADAPLTWRGAVRAAVWDAGPRALASHHTAARLFRFPGFDDDSVEVLVPKSLDHVCTIATVHESRRFDRVRSTSMWDIPTVARADTIVHLAPYLRVKRMGWLVDELLFTKRFDLRTLNAAFGRLAPGARGMCGLRAVLSDHSDGAPVPESELERLFLTAATSRQLPQFTRQAHIEGRSQRPSRVDFLWPDVKLIVELDGRRWHARFTDFDHDHRRDLHALAHGYRTARITWPMLTQDPDEVCADLLAARKAAA